MVAEHMDSGLRSISLIEREWLHCSLALMDVTSALSEVRTRFLKADAVTSSLSVRDITERIDLELAYWPTTGSERDTFDNFYR